MRWSWQNSFLPQSMPAAVTTPSVLACVCAQVVMHGLPIRPAFSEARASQAALRKRLSMDRHLPAVLLVGAAMMCFAEGPRGLVQS